MLTIQYGCLLWLFWCFHVQTIAQCAVIRGYGLIMLTIHLTLPAYKSNVLNSYVTSFRALNSELNGTHHKNLVCFRFDKQKIRPITSHGFLSFPRGFCGLFTRYVHGLNPSSIHLIHEISRCFILHCQVSKPLDVSVLHVARRSFSVHAG